MNNEKVKCPDCKGKGNAAERVRNGMPTYSNVPSGLKYLRRVPILGGFTSFPNVFRTKEKQT